MTQPLTLDSVTTRSVDGLDIRVADSGQSRPVTLLMTSPWPESLFAFRKIWGALAPLARLVAIDLPGFGHSQARVELFDPPAMAEFVETLITDMGLDRPHVFGPDVGTSTALFLAASHPGSVSSVIVGSGGASYPLRVAGALADIIGLDDIDALRDQDIRATIGVSLEPAASSSDEPEIWEDYVSAYENGRFAESARFVRSYPTALARLGPLLPAIDTPALIVNATQDPLVPPENGEYLHQRLRRGRLVTVDAPHYGWEVESTAYAHHIADWITGGSASAGS
ncbi:MAG: alpha/beta hydrolase [Nocardiaceae bacterium]|nr:alpha/beta hydrolase [Nocardiaceae bacterium]